MFSPSDGCTFEMFSPPAALRFCWVTFGKIVSALDEFREKVQTALNNFKEKLQTLKIRWKFVNPISAPNYFHELCGRNNISKTTVALKWGQTFWEKQLEVDSYWYFFLLRILEIERGWKIQCWLKTSKAGYKL